MAEFTQFEKSEPIEMPAVEAKTFDKYWLSKLLVSAPSPRKETMVYAEFVPCRDAEDGIKELKPEITNDEKKTLRVDNLEEIMESNPLFIAALEGVFKALKAYGSSEDLF